MYARATILKHKPASPFPGPTHYHKSAAQLCKQLFGLAYLASCFSNEE